MRKIILVVIVIALIPSLALAESTKRRGLVEFCELYMQRFTKYQDVAGEDFDITILPSNAISVPSATGQNMIMFDSTAGNIDVITNDYTIQEIRMKLVDLDASESDTNRIGISCMMAFSALEYDDADNRMFKITSATSGETGVPAIDRAIDLFHEVTDAVTEYGFDEAINTGREVFLFSANYDYYVSYVYNEYSGRQYEYFNLIARARY